MFLLTKTDRLFSQTVVIDSTKNIVNPDSVYSEVDIPAELPKGKEARIQFMQKNIDAAVGIKNGAPMGIYNIRIVCIQHDRSSFCATDFYLKF